MPKGCVRHYHSWYSEQEQQSEQEEAQAEINTERERESDRERGERNIRMRDTLPNVKIHDSAAENK